MAVIGALAAAAVLAPLAGALARRTGIVDRPGPLKVHAVPVPYLGGLAVLVAASPWVASARPALLVPLGAALAVGVADDARGLSPRVRLVAELAIGISAAWAVDTRLPDGAHAAFVIVAVIVLANGVNVIDGLDGLAASVSLVALAALAVTTGGDDRTAALALAGATAGFLVHNRPPARIYLGDGGSYLLGTALALMLAVSWSPDRPATAGVGALFAVAFPAGELIVAAVRRARAGRPLFQGDREHTYDRLVDRGWRPSTATLACVALAAGLAGIGALVAQA